jgi:hypothetical protein
VELDWDEANLEHIARHQLEAWEVEEALADPERIPLKVYHVAQEKRQGFIAKTAAGRVLAIILTLRHKRYRVVTAREASRNEKRLYRRSK